MKKRGSRPDDKPSQFVVDLPFELVDPWLGLRVKQAELPFLPASDVSGDQMQVGQRFSFLPASFQKRHRPRLKLLILGGNG